jgi:hypothetical protein
MINSQSLPVLKINTLSSTSNLLLDDIEPGEWLEEIDLAQYTETFATNFCSQGGRVLSRKRLSLVKRQHLSQMGITQLEHQKILMEHIQHSLLHAFHAPLRQSSSPLKSRMKKTNFQDEGAIVIENTNKVLPPIISARSAQNIVVMGGSVPRAQHSKKVKPGRRRSFDQNAWDAIEKTRNKGAGLEVVDFIRDGNANVSLAAPTVKKTDKTRRSRRWSFDEDLNTGTGLNRAKLYGNRALEFDMLQKELRLLQHDHLAWCKAMIKCEMATIVFIHERTRELIMCTDDNWYRLPQGCGLAGYCAEFGEGLNIHNAYEDARFNRNVDVKIGFKTRSILVQPLRAHRGGGHIIGVIQMINKLDAPHFDDNDEDVLAACVQRVSDDLSTRFKDLMFAAEKFAGNSIFVGGKDGENFSSSPSRIDRPTKNSIAAAVQKSDVHDPLAKPNIVL